MLYLDLDDAWIFNALTVLQDYGYIRPPFFVFPPTPVGAHIKIVTKREAEDYELFGEKGRDVSHLIGRTVEFEVVTAHVSYPRIKKYGIEARYKIRVKSPEHYAAFAAFHQITLPLFAHLILSTFKTYDGYKK